MTLTPLLIREVKAFIKNPAFILSIVFIIGFYGILGRLMSTGIQTAVEQTLNMQIGVVLYDSSDFAVRVLSVANKTSGGRLQLVPSLEAGLSIYDIVVVIPSDFTIRVMELDKPINIESYIKINTISPVVSGAKTNIITVISDLIRKSISYVIAIERNIDPSLINKHVLMNTTLQVYGKIMKLEEYSTISFLMGFVPMMIAIIMGINAAYASQFTATEKVEKAFEMLLAQPIPRRNIVFAKIIGSIIASLLMGIAYFTGMFLILLSATTSTPNTIGNTTGLSVNIIEIVSGKIGFNALLVSIATIILGLIYSGALGITIGSIVSDERIAGALTAPIIFTFIGIGYALIFIGLPVNIITGVIAGITIAPLPVIALVSTMIGDFTVLTTSLLFAVLSTIVVMGIAIHIYNRDIVVLGLRISRFKLKERK
ncbi:MAG: ABC transporter permease [Desulfurococcaceae archaeon]|nr:ABC transporter permease [Desulfurococcaceae archaeon]